MMNYEEFKSQVIDTFATYLPEEYKGSKVSVTMIPKINVEMDAINVECPRESEVVAQPILYLQGLYGEYTKTKNLQGVLKQASKVFVHYCNFPDFVSTTDEGLLEKDRIVINLISTEKNGHLLNHCPHREILDMAVIYRQVVFLADGSFNGSIVTNQQLNSLDITEEELHSLALANTERMFPVDIHPLDEKIYLVTNQCKAHGAATMLYEGLLAEIAEKFQDDLYIIPSSIHEIILIGITGENADRMRALVVDANRDMVKKPVILTDTIYQYRRNEKDLIVASQKNKGPVA